MPRAYLAALLLVACGGDPTPDAGSPDAAAPMDAGLETCAADRECDDSLFCTVHECRPGAPGADARGCLSAGSPCAVGEMCDEAGGVCAPEVCGAETDRDGDGHDSLACGGNDCDDDDDQRYGGNAEVCDGVHDEDCDDTTVAGASDGDMDGDGFISDACCNGASCADDCDDSDRGTFPGARELCNGRDDDCDGMSDEAGATPLCPGGVCVAGRCDLEGWDRTFGGVDSDGGAAVAMDAVGNVYVAATVDGDVDFATGVDVGLGDRDVALVAYGPDGTYRWHRRYGSAGLDSAWDVTVDPTTRNVYLVGTLAGDGDLGGGVSSGPRGFLLALDDSGSYRWDVSLPASVILSAHASDGAVSVGGWFTSPFDFGDGMRTLEGADAAGFIVRYTSEGAHEWDRVLGGGVGSSAFAAVASGGSDEVLVIGAYQGGSVDLGSGPRTLSGISDLFVASYGTDGAPSWDFTVGGSSSVNASDAVRLASGDVVVGGNFSGTVDLGGGELTAASGGSSFLFMLSAGGAYLRERTWGGDGGDSVSGVGATAAGDVVAVGRFAGTVNFGGGTRTAAGMADLFVATFTDVFAHRRDFTFGATGRNEATGVAVGPADSTAVVGAFFEMIDLGSGLRTSAGDTDAFVLRIPN